MSRTLTYNDNQTLVAAIARAGGDQSNVVTLSNQREATEETLPLAVGFGPPTHPKLSPPPSSASPTTIKGLCEVFQQKWITDDFIHHKLCWQGTESTGISFKAKVPQRFDLTVFGYMVARLTFIRTIHSIGTYLDKKGGASELAGKMIGFVGNRSQGTRPMLVIVPPNSVGVEKGKRE